MHKIWETSLFCSCQTEDDLLCIVCEIQSDTPPNILQLSEGQIAWDMSCDRFNVRGTQSFSQGLVQWMLAKSFTEFSQVIAQSGAQQGGKKKVIFPSWGTAEKKPSGFPGHPADPVYLCPALSTFPWSHGWLPAPQPCLDILPAPDSAAALALGHRTPLSSATSAGSKACFDSLDRRC